MRSLMALRVAGDKAGRCARGLRLGILTAIRLHNQTYEDARE
jgi:hypothetical protein